MAGTLDIILSLPSFVWSLWFGLALFFSGNQKGEALAPLFLIGAAFWIPTLAGGICALCRRLWWLALFGSVLPPVLSLFTFTRGVRPIWALWVPYVNIPLIVSLNRLFDFLGYAIVLVAIILIALSQKEFGRQQRVPDESNKELSRPE